MPWYYGDIREVSYPGRPGQGLPRPPRPTDPDWGIEEGGSPEHPIRPPWEFPERPGHGLPPMLPPALPGHPMPPSPEFPMVPIPPEGPETLPPGAVWPPFPGAPERPDLSGKCLALVWIPGVGAKYVVLDLDALPRPPAGGIGRPPQRPQPT